MKTKGVRRYHKKFLWQKSKKIFFATTMLFLLNGITFGQDINPICNVYLDVLQTRNNPSQIVGTTTGVKSYIHNTQDCQLQTGYVYQDPYDHGLECDSGEFATATGTYATSLNVDYTFSVESADTDSSPAVTIGMFGAPDETINEDNEILPLSQYDDITQDWHHYSFSLTYNGDKSINSIKDIIGNVSFENIDNTTIKIGSFTTATWDTTNLYFKGIAKKLEINELKSQGSNQFFTALEANEEIRIGTFELASSNYDNITIKAPKVVIDTLDLSNDNADIIIYADEVYIGDLKFAQKDKVTFYPYTPGKRIQFFSNSIEASSSSSMVMSSGDYYTKSLTVPGTGTGERTFIALDANQLINFIIDDSVELGNNPGINSEGNNGNFGSLPPANFRMFINGDLTTGGGGTTFNAIVYVEGKTDLGSPTYLRGALSSGNDITIGNGSHFYADDSVNEAGWGECAPREAPEFENQYSCGIFGSVLISYEQIIMGQNDVYNACEISVKGLDFDEDTNGVDVTCYTGEEGSSKCVCTPTEDTKCSKDGSCTIVPEPKNKYSHNFIETTITTNISTSEDINFTELEYGNYTFTGNSGDNQQIYFNPQVSYKDKDTKVMLLGDFEFAGNDQTIIFEGGDYYFKSFKIDKDNSGNINQVDICAKGDVRIFIQGDFVYSGNHINDAACGGKIFVYVEGDAIVDSNGGGSSDIPVFIYSRGDVTIEPSGDASKWVGAITAEGKININKGNSTSNFNFYYDDSAGDFGLGDCQMCYTDIYVSGISFDFGSCPGISFSVGSDIRVPIETNESLRNVTINEAHTDTAFSFSLLSNQEVIDQDGQHIRDAQVESSSVLNAGAFGMDISILASEVITYPLGDDNYNYGPTSSDSYQQLHSSTLFGFDFCQWRESLLYVAHYDDSSGRHYDVVLSQCKKNGEGEDVNEIGLFDAWDSFRDIDNKEISTKIVNKPFELTISYIDVNGTIPSILSSDKECQYRLVDAVTGSELTSWQNFNTKDGKSQNISFTVSKATTKAYVEFQFCQDKNTKAIIEYSKCPEEGEFNTTRSSDYFAIKPASFAIEGISTTTSYKAGDDLNITFKALDYNSNPAANFTEAVGATFKVEFNESKTNCLKGVFNPAIDSGWQFDNGAKTLTTKYSEVGKVNITISDKDINCLARFAGIDCKDKNVTGYWDSDVNTTIGEAKVENITFLPDHFDINGSFRDFHIASGVNDMNFTYLSSDLDMATTLSFDVTAKTKDNTATANYNKDCYAKDLSSVDIGYKINFQIASSTNPGEITKVNFSLVDDKSYEDNESQALSNKISISSSIPAEVFNTDHNGTAKFSMKINFDRKNSKPIQPFVMNITDINITDADGVGSIISNRGELDNNTTFIYARVKSSQKLYDDVTSPSVKTPISVVVYYLPAGPVSLDNTLFTPTNEYDWFLNTLHNPTKDGVVNLVPTDSSKADISTPNLTGGIDTAVTVTAKVADRPLEIDVNLTGTDKWLIFNPDSEDEPVPFYKVRFVGQSGWTGYGKTGKVVDTNSSKIKTKRLEW